ncbi:hypothetical protein [Demequina flava]|uniref:hypothetical protein n=1 Tax=Demequina flava TaxID=1095025 RepID=UPI0007801E76|nr:hypothetical protein [Demequina flava]
MRGLRTLLSAISILVGAVLIVAWAVSSVAVRTVEDGTALTGITETAFDIPGVVSGLSGQIQDQAIDGLAEQGIDTESLGVDDEVRGAVDTAVRSDAFEDAVVAQVAAAQDDFLYQLTHPDTAAGPLVLQVDISSLINARIDDIGQVGAAVPDVSVEPVPVEVLTAERMSDAQTGYAWMERLASWGLWAGLAMLAFGILVSHRRRWFVAKALLAIGVLALGFGAVVRFIDPSAVAAFLPGDAEGIVGSLWLQWITEESSPAISTRAFLIGGLCVAGAVVVTAVGRIFGGRR